jgi:GNAT superfamily N-acetyltransferase
MSISIRRLDDSARASLVAHFLALPVRDRRLRFGTSPSAAVLAAYVDGIDFGRDTAFGIEDDWRTLVGVVHVAFVDDAAELGLSVLPAHRGFGLGAALVRRAAAHARNRRASHLLMRCLCGNAPVIRIARRFGMDVLPDGSDARADLELAPPTFVSIAEELATDAIARFYQRARNVRRSSSSCASVSGGGTVAATLISRAVSSSSSSTAIAAAGKSCQTTGPRRLSMTARIGVPASP